MISNHSTDGNLENLISTVFNSDSYNSLTAMPALKKMGRKGVSPLLDALRDADANMRWRAAIALQALGEPAVDDLIHFLIDESPPVREHILWALGKINDTRATPYLIEAMNDDNSVIRHIAAESLGEFKDEHVLDHLRHYQNDDDELVRHTVEESIQRIS
ncbi:MAG: HEAT repeat domain-containing protein [Methanomicrobiaceae archaeon]|nr:HEAT repeat domain-containing protein [Methanomicrobiaceae archaeon]